MTHPKQTQNQSRTSSSKVPGFLRRQGFSLVEVVVAIAIVATAMVAVVGLMPLAMQASREAIDETAVSLVMEDVRNQLRGTQVPLDASSKFAHGSFYYDQQGQFVHFEPASAGAFGVPASTDLAAPASTGRQVVVAENANFRADVTIVPVGAYDSSHDIDGDPSGMVTVMLEIYSPINPANGAPLPVGAAEPIGTASFVMSRLTDPGWELYETSYQPRLEI